MKRCKSISAFVLLACMIVVMVGCSGGGKNPVQSSTEEPDDQTFFSDARNISETRSWIAVYDALIDPDAGTFEIRPVEREGAYHFPLSQTFPNVLQITGYGYTPYFWADIKLTHPYPGSGIAGFDPRVIAILPANTGNEMVYPVFNVQANNAVVLQPDGYTKMHDSLGGTIPGNTNPYLSYFRTQPYRVWMPTGVTQDTRRWYLKLSGFGGPMNFKLVVDVCTNYPNPPTPVVDNAQEPIPIAFEIDEGLTPDGGSANVIATFIDWQGPSEIKCKVESPALFNSAIELFYSEPGPNPNQYIFKGTISNDLVAPEGLYDVLLAAWDVNLGLHRFRTAKAEVKGLNLNPVDVTPPMLGLYPGEIAVVSDLAYIASELEGLVILDVSDPENILFFNQVDIPGRSRTIKIMGNYAYIGTVGYSGEQYGLAIIDISDPGSASIVNIVEMSNVNGVDVKPNFAYLCRNNDGVSIVDVSVPENAFIVKTVSTGGQCRNISYSDGYLYVAHNLEIKIMDVDPPESASVVKTVSSTHGYIYDIASEGDYAYAAAGDGLWILDISTPESAAGIHHVARYWTCCVSIKGTNAYVAGKDDDDVSELSIIDITVPGSASVTDSVNIDKYGKIFVNDENVAFIASGEYGLDLVNVHPSEPPELFNWVHTTVYAHDIDISGENAFMPIADDDYINKFGLVDISTPESAEVVKAVRVNGYYSSGISVDGNYAYVTDYYSGLNIFDISDPHLPLFVTDLFIENAYKVFARGDYVYVIDDENLWVVDVSIPGSPDVEDILGLILTPKGIWVDGNFAYVADYGAGLDIIDINNPTNVFIVKTVALLHGYSAGVCVADGYAYVVGYDADLQIIDVDPPASAYVEKEVTLSEYAYGVYAAGKYAYITDYSGLHIVDVEVIADAYIVDSIELPGGSLAVLVKDGYAYVASREAGLRIVDLYY